LASLIRKPWFEPAEYIACTWAVTFHSTQPALERDGALAAAPVGIGWLFQFTPPSAH
jgi:hypothetical protein